MEPDRGARADDSHDDRILPALLPMTPVVLLADEIMTNIVLAGIDRAGAGPKVGVSKGDGTEDARVPVDVLVLIADPSKGLREDADQLIARGARPLPALQAASGVGVTPAAIDQLRQLPAGLNVPVPSIDDEAQRRQVWGSLRDADVHVHLHLVEVDGQPALDELASRGTPARGDPLALLAAGAAGVLAGRMAAGNLRWREHPA